MDGVEEWRDFSLATTKKQKVEKLRSFVSRNLKTNMTEMEAKRVRGYILASLGEL